MLTRSNFATDLGAPWALDELRNRPWRFVGARPGSSQGIFGRSGGRLGSIFGLFFVFFGGCASVLTKNDRHAIRMRHGERIACRVIRDGLQNRSEITPRASRERLSENIVPKRPLELARAPFWIDLARFWMPSPSTWLSFVSFWRLPIVSRGAPAAPRLAPDRPGGAPDAPGPIWDRFWLRFGLIWDLFWQRLFV